MDEELTDEQIAYCRELADAERARWAKSRPMTYDERQAMEKATRELDAEAKALLDGRK